jgi:hypothetical protein
MNFNLVNVRKLVSGPAVALPSPVDMVCERWARLPVRLRMLVVVLLMLAAALAAHRYVARVEARWGGRPVTVLRAVVDMPIGASVRGLEPFELPSAAVPPRAVRTVPGGARLSLPLPAGSVLTEAHLDPRGPAAGLPPDERAVPVPVEAGWRVEPGGWVDVWVLGAGERPSQLVASARPVLQVREEQGNATALVALRSGEVAATTAGMALGTILLAHSPPPLDERGPPPAG